jgi:zinc D-Ala-D-Ala dipeptidase
MSGPRNIKRVSRTRMPMISSRIGSLKLGSLNLTSLGFFLLALTSSFAAAKEPLPEGFVYLRGVDPTIAQDIRYASANNFTGRPLPGYSAPECVLRREVAEALKRVQTDLVSSRLGLKVYDCYRPVRAVHAMYAWASDGSNGRATKRFFPALDKRTLFASGYIAMRSAHSTGTAVDLTLIKLPAASVAPFDSTAAYGSCIGPAAERAPDNSLDMGTGFDCFDVKSHTANTSISPDARQWRAMFVAAMRKRDLKNYFREWWHFSYGTAPSRVYDFPIVARGR